MISRSEVIKKIMEKTGSENLVISTTGMISREVFNHKDRQQNFYMIGSMGLASSFALLCSVVAYFIYFKILQGTGAGNLLLCTIIIPPSAIILNAIFLSEAISHSELFGLLLIVFGLLILDGRILEVILGRRLK